VSDRPTRTTHRTQVGQAYRAIKVVSIGLVGITVTLVALAIFVIGYVSLHTEVDVKTRDSLCHIRHDYKRMIRHGRSDLVRHPGNATLRLDVRSWRQTYQSLNMLHCKS
jgi:hypothetical protein